MKKYGSDIPEALQPILSGVLGVMVGHFTNLGAAYGGVLGLAGVGVREVVDQVKKFLDSSAD